MAKLLLLLVCSVAAISAIHGRQEIRKSSPFDIIGNQNGDESAARAMTGLNYRRRPWHRFLERRGEHGPHHGGHHRLGSLPGRSQTGRSGLHGLAHSGMTNVGFNPFAGAHRGGPRNHHHDQLMTALRNDLRRQRQGLNHHRGHPRRPSGSDLPFDGSRLGFQPLGHGERDSFHPRGYRFRGHGHGHGHGRGGRGRGHHHGMMTGFGGRRHGVGHRGGYGMGPRYDITV